MGYDEQDDLLETEEGNPEDVEEEAEDDIEDDIENEESEEEEIPDYDDDE